MISIARLATHFSLLLAVVLTAFLLSGTTSSQPAISNLHVAKLELNSTRVAAVTSIPTGVISFPTATRYAGATTQRATTTIAAASTTRIVNAASKVSTGSVQKQKTTSNPLSAAATMEVVRRDKDDGHPNNIFQKYKSQIDYEKQQPAKNGNVLRSRAITTVGSTTGESDHTNERAIVLIGYFGICAKNFTTPYSCTKSRRGADILEGATPEMLKLAVSIQGAISPLPPIIAITFQGMLMFLACFTCFRPGTDLNTKFGQALALLAFAAFSLSLFTAILFQSASAVVYGAFSTSPTMIASKGSSGIALAWAAVFFTGLGMCGVVFLLLAGGFKKQTKRHVKEFGLASRVFGSGDRDQPDIRPPLPVHRGHSNESRMPERERRRSPMNEGNYF